MILGKKIDNNGIFIEDVILDSTENIPNDIILDDVPDGFYHPKWNGTSWVEGKPQAEIDARLIAENNAQAKADLIQLDLESIRPLREYLASLPDAPQILKDKENLAVQTRAKIK